MIPLPWWEGRGEGEKIAQIGWIVFASPIWFLSLPAGSHLNSVVSTVNAGPPPAEQPAWFTTETILVCALPGRTPKARPARFTTESTYFASAAFCMPASSFLMSSGDSFGRSTLIVSLLSLAVRVKGGL